MSKLLWVVSIIVFSSVLLIIVSFFSKYPSNVRYKSEESIISKEAKTQNRAIESNQKTNFSSNYVSIAVGEYPPRYSKFMKGNGIF